jgi:hypothetical protein
MKKIASSISITLLVAAAFWLAACQSTQVGGERTTVLSEFTGDKTKTTLDNGGFENWLNDWIILSGEAFTPAAIVDTQLKFWGEQQRDFMAKGNYFLNGYENPENATGKMRSQLFTLAGDGWISFMMGGAKTNKCYISVHTEDGREIARYSNIKDFKDPEMVLNLHREYMDISAHIGKVLYIQINDDDNREGDFAAITADDFIVSMTADDVKALMKSTYQEIMDMEDIAVNRYIKQFYKTYKYPFPLEE